MSDRTKSLLFGLDISMTPAAQAELETQAALETEIYAWRYAQFDSAMRERSTHIGPYELRNYLHNKQLHPAFGAVQAAKRISMLHEDALMLLRMYACAAKGGILEIGPYVGGSTLALAGGARDGLIGAPFASIELGGRYPEHPHIPSGDIYGDLVKNVSEAGLAEHVTLINGSSRDSAVVARVEAILGGKPISLVFLDSDGHIEADWDIYARLLADDAVLVLDDYEAPISPLKTDLIRPWVAGMLEKGHLRELGVFGWGTWFGQVTDKFVSWRKSQPATRAKIAPNSTTGVINPHFDQNLVVWDDSYSGKYQAVPYAEQFDDQWRLFLERARGFCDHTGVETTDKYIEDRIEELTGVDRYLERRKAGEKVTEPSGRSDSATRATGGTLLIEPKFAIDRFRGKRCLDVGCGAGRWTRVLVELGGKVKSLDVSEHGIESTRRFNADVERLDIFGLAGRPDLHGAFDFVICWGVVMCTHDPKVAFDLVAKTVKPGGELYVMVYAPTFHVSEFALQNRKKFHRECKTFDEKLAFAYKIADSPDNAINLMDMLNTFYNWTIPEQVIHDWYKSNGFEAITTLNRNEMHNCGWHILGRKRLA